MKWARFWGCLTATALVASGQLMMAACSASDGDVFSNETGQGGASSSGGEGGVGLSPKAMVAELSDFEGRPQDGENLHRVLRSSAPCTCECHPKGTKPTP